jgi:hypothetical protein
MAVVRDAMPPPLPFERVDKGMAYAAGVGPVARGHLVAAMT